MLRTRFLHIFVLLLLPLGIFAQTSGEAALADRYFEEADYPTALELYEKVFRKNSDEKHYIYRIAACHSYLGQYDDGIKFLDKLIKRNESEYDYQILKADLLTQKGKTKDSDKLLDEIIYKKLRTPDEFGRVAAFFNAMQKQDRALETLLEGRKSLRNDAFFIDELISLYQDMGEYGAATSELLRKYSYDPGALNSVKLDILNMTGPASKDAIEDVLLTEVQKNQKERGLRNIIYEFYVLNENFYEAWIQVRSIDKVFKGNGDGVYKFALTMRSNKQYKLSNKALDYIIEDHQNSPYYFLAYKEKTVNNELQAFESVPLDTAAVREAVIAYEELLTKFGRKPSFFDAMYRKANLTAFYLHDLESAYSELDQLLKLPLKNSERAKGNLLIGDILLMQKEFNKAKLKYSEVASSYKDEQLGALAKYKEGQMAYYKGDFEYSQGRLKSIKDNTSNDISNDAIRLNMLIQDNTGLDSTTTALERFASAQLLIYQREYSAASGILDSLLYNFPNHTLTDEILWEQSKIALTRSEVDKAILLLDKIIDNHGEDILADDALYTKCRIFDFNLENKEKAMTLYLQMLRDFPGSLHSVDVRKRIRELRQDYRPGGTEGGVPRG